MSKERTALLQLFKTTSKDAVSCAVLETHRKLALHEPKISEIAEYRKACGGRAQDVENIVTQRCIESLLFLRTKPLKPGQLPVNRRDFQKEIELMLWNNVSPKDKEHQKKFDKLVLSFSRLFALYYVDENDRQLMEADGRLNALVPKLAEHLMAELELCMEARFTNPSNNLCKVSIFDIQEKLEMLQSHSDENVRKYAKTIISKALAAGTLEMEKFFE